jgi:hypothetical protein
MVFGIFYYNNFWGITSISAGAGHFISDLEDFLHFRFWGVDKFHKWKFWSIK